MDQWIKLEVIDRGGSRPSITTVEPLSEAHCPTF